MQSKFKLLKLGLLTLICACAGASCQQSRSVQAARENNSPVTKDVLLSPADRNFMKAAEDMDIKQRNLARVIIERTENTQVRDYAKMLNDNHTEDLRNVVDLMESKGIHQPKDMPEVKHEALAELNGLVSPALDRDYIDTMIKDHQKYVAEYTAETQNGEDPAVRDYSARALETWQKHLSKAEVLQSKLLKTSGQ